MLCAENSEKNCMFLMSDKYILPAHNDVDFRTIRYSLKLKLLWLKCVHNGNK